MNTLESYDTSSPTGADEICGKFTIEEVLSPFVLHNITTVGETYTLSLWIRSDAEGKVLIRGNTILTTTEWVRHEFTFTASAVNLNFYFNVAGTYYIYHPQLEYGTKATDWIEAPEDLTERVEKAKGIADAAELLAEATSSRVDNAESLILQINNLIANLVTDANGTSLMTQTADGGWTYSMAQTENTINEMVDLLADLEESLGATDATVEALAKNLTSVESSIEWVRITTYEDEPCIALGESDSDFKLLITNTRIIFLEGRSVPAYISNRTLHIKKAVIEEELQQGDFVWKIRSNGNMGLIWKGASS